MLFKLISAVLSSAT